MSSLFFIISNCFLWTGATGVKLSARPHLQERKERVVVTPRATTDSAEITKEELLEITALIENDGVYIREMPESPYLRIGFHVAASFDRKLQSGGWGDLPTRHAMKSAGLLDDILIVYWDVMAEYWDNHEDELHGMSKADFISYVIYMYSKSGIFTPNVTWRAGRPDSGLDSGGHMKFGRPYMGEGMSRAFKPEANMTSSAYLREFFSRLNFEDDREVALLMTAHALGSARGLPYLGELASKHVTHYKIDDTNTTTCGVGTCYFWDMLNLGWEVGCPTSCETCQWGTPWKARANYNSKDPYNTTWVAAPSNYTNPSAWGDNCTLALAKQNLFQYRDTESYGVMRLPVEMSMLEDESYRSSMAWYSEHGAEDKVYVLDFARAYSKMLEVGVPEEKLYFIMDLQGATPPFSDAAGRPPSATDDDDEEVDDDDLAIESSTDLEKSRDLSQTRGIRVHFPTSFVDAADDYDEARNSSTDPVHIPTLVDEFN
jgi:hypothetical protein